MKELRATLQGNEVVFEYKGFIVLEKNENVLVRLTNVKSDAIIFVNDREIIDNTFVLNYNDIKENINFPIVVKWNGNIKKYAIKQIKAMDYKLIGDLTDNNEIVKLHERIETLQHDIDVLEQAYMNLYELKTKERDLV